LARALETVVEEDWCDWVFKTYNLIALKFTPLGRNGYPDRLVFLPGGEIFLIEFKRVDEDPEPLQIYIHEELEKLEHVVWVTDNLEEAKQVFREHIEAILGRPTQSLGTFRATI